MMKRTLPKNSGHRNRRRTRFPSGLVSIVASILLCLSAGTALAGELISDATAIVPVTGIVTDTDGDPLPGVGVSVKGTTTGTTTGLDGRFTLNVPDNAVLVFSFLGYVAQELTPVTGRQMTVVMEEDTKRIDDVVVMGYTRQNRRDVAASVAKVDMKALEYNSAPSLATMLAGQAPGLQTVVRSGIPGSSGGGIVIRGNNSLSAGNDLTGISSPLYIVDGIPMQLQDIAGFNVSDNDFLSSLNPNEIQAIDILKDAAATAIYGSRGANGVVIITTKKGTSGKARINASVSAGMTVKPERLKVYTGEAERQAKLGLINQTLDNLYGDMEWFDIRGVARLEILGYTLPAVLTDKYNPAFNNAYDYQKMFYQTGKTQDYDLSLEGGGATNSYRIGLGHYNEKGVLVGYGFARTTVNASVISDINKMFRNEFLVRYSFQDRKGGLNDQMKAMPTAPTSLPSSLYSRTEEELAMLSGQLGDAYNKNQNHSISFGETLRTNILENLSWDNQATVNLNYGINNYFIPATARAEEKSYAVGQSSLNTTFTANSVMNYRYTVKDHSLFVLAGAEINMNTFQLLSARGEDGMSDYMKMLQGYKNENTSVYSDLVKTNMVSYFGQVAYDFKDKRYKIEGVLRRDGSSRFGANNKWATFPSMTAQWAFSKEPWMKNANWLDFGKLRFSFGTSGDIYHDALLQYNSLVALNGMGAGIYGIGSNKMDVKSYGGVSAIISDFNRIANKDLSWSRSKELNYGIDLEMFESRLYFNGDIYSKYLSDLVYTSYLPAYVGFNSLQSNLVDMVSNGFEVGLTGYLFPRTSDIQWEWTLNLSRNRTKIAKMGNNGRDYINIGERYAFVEGKPAFQYYMFEYVGTLDNFSDLPVDPYLGLPLMYNNADAGLGRNLQGRIFPGMPIFTDVNGDFKVNGNTGAEDRKIIEGKTPEPKINGGLHTFFRFKNFSVRVQSSFAFGHHIFNTTLQQQLSRFDHVDQFYQYALYKFDEKKFWKKPGDGSYYPMIYVSYSDGGSSRSFRESSMFLEKGDYWSIDNVSVSYNLPKKWTDQIGIRGTNVYMNVSNVYLWKKSGVSDPRLISRTGFYNGEGYPVSRTYLFGIRFQL